MASDLNTVALSGRLARDPELRQTNGGTDVCKLRLAFTTRRKSGDTWEDKSNFLDVIVWGAQGKSAAEHLSKGRQVGVTGRIEWREYEKDGTKRQAVEVVAENLRFLGPKPESNGTGEASGGNAEGSEAAPF